MAGMITSIVGTTLSFLCCGFYGVMAIPCIAGAVLGIMSRKRIAESNGQLGGDAMALTALIVGAVGAVWAVLWLVLRFAFRTYYWY